MKKIILSIILTNLLSFTNAQFTETANVTTPGTLNTVAKTYLNSVNNLIVTGTIDARDFKTMRDSMPALIMINLNSVTIAEYSGPVGTKNGQNDTSSYVYSANAIPILAFCGNGKISSLLLPSSITYIGDFAFYGCSFRIITIPSLVDSIGTNALVCPKLTDIIDLNPNPTPLLLYSYGNNSFFGDNTLKGLYVPIGSVEKYETAKIWYSFNISAIIDTTANVTTPGTLNTVAKSYLTPFASAILKVTGTIDARDFKTMRDSMGLVILDLSGATIAAYNGTAGTQDLNNDYYPANTIPQYAFFNTKTFSQLGGIGYTELNSVTLPNNVTSIGEDAFSMCTGLTGSLTIPSSITYIGNNAFEGCYGFTGSLNIPSSVDSIGGGAFSDCYGFTGSLTIPSSVTSIGYGAFFDCYRLTDTLTIPSSVTYIGNNAFGSCSNFTSIIELNPLPLKGNNMGSYVFSGDININNLYVPCGSVNAYKATPQWNVFNILINAQTQTKTVNVTTPGTLNILVSSYLSCISNLTITGTIDARDFKTMRDSMPLLSVLNISNTTIAPYTGTAGTQDANNDIYPEIVIPQYAFYNNKTHIGKTSLTAVKFPTNITSIRDYAFNGCTGLTGSLIIPSSVTYIGDFAFNGCYGLTGSLNIPSSVTSIGICAFNGCTGFTGSLTIPASVMYIGDYAFTSTKNWFTSIIALNPTPLTGNAMGNNVFYLNSLIIYLYVPCGSINAYKSVKQWNSVNIFSNDMFVPISASADTVIKGTSVTFTSNTSCMSGSVSLQWQVNQKNVGTGVSTFSYIPLNGDIVTCLANVNGNIITSNAILMNIIVPNLSVSTNTLNVSYASNSQAFFTINSNIKWSISSKYNWLTPSVSFGYDTTVITLTATANPTIRQRIDTITVSGSGVTSQKIIVTQAAGLTTLSVSEYYLNIDATANSKVSFYIYSNNGWKLTTGKSQKWLTPSTTFGSDTTLITLTASANPWNKAQYDTIIITANEINIEVFVNQTAGRPTLSVSTNTLNIAAADNSQTLFEINSNEAWSLTNSKTQTWLAPNIIFGSDTTLITLTATANPRMNERIDTVIISGTGVVSQKVIVTQAPGKATLSVSKDTLYIAAAGKSTRNFNIYANEAWNLTTSKAQNWLTPSITLGSDTSEITLTASANTNSKERNDTLTVSAFGVKTDTIIVTQAAGSVTGVIYITESDVTIYPIPVFDNLTISIPNTEDQTSLAIYNMNGVKIYSSVIINPITTIDMSMYDTGVYIVKIIMLDNGIITKKIIKQ